MPERVSKLLYIHTFYTACVLTSARADTQLTASHSDSQHTGERLAQGRGVRDVVNMGPDLDRGATPLVSDAHSTLFHSTFTTAACLTLESALRAVAFQQLRCRGLCAQ